MNAIPTDPADQRREVDRWLGNYSEDHRNPTNIAVHWICVPLILWTVIALLWVVPVPAMLGRAGLWAAVAMFAALTFYLRSGFRPCRRQVQVADDPRLAGAASPTAAMHIPIIK